MFWNALFLPLVIAQYPTGYIKTLMGSGLGTFSEGNFKTAGLVAPRSLSILDNGDIIWIETGGKVRRGSPTLNTTSPFILTTVSADSVILSNLNTTFIADPVTDVLYKMSNNGTAVEIVAGALNNSTYVDGPIGKSRLKSPIAMAFDARGDILLVDDMRIRKFFVANSTLVTLMGNDTLGLPIQGAFTSPPAKGKGIAVDNLNNIYIIDNTRHALYVLTPNGILQEQLIKATSCADMSAVYAPESIVSDMWGNLYVADGCHRIKRITPSKAVSILVGSGNGILGFVDGEGPLGLLNGPKALAMGPFSILHVSDTSNNRIRVVPVLQSTVTTRLGYPIPLVTNFPIMIYYPPQPTSSTTAISTSYPLNMGTFSVGSTTLPPSSTPVPLINSMTVPGLIDASFHPALLGIILTFNMAVVPTVQTCSGLISHTFATTCTISPFAGDLRRLLISETGTLKPNDRINLTVNSVKSTASGYTNAFTSLPLNRPPLSLMSTPNINVMTTGLFGYTTNSLVYYPACKDFDVTISHLYSVPRNFDAITFQVTPGATSMNNFQTTLQNQVTSLAFTPNQRFTVPAAQLSVGNYRINITYTNFVGYSTSRFLYVNRLREPAAPSILSANFIDDSNIVFSFNAPIKLSLSSTQPVVNCSELFASSTVGGKTLYSPELPCVLSNYRGDPTKIQMTLSKDSKITVDDYLTVVAGKLVSRDEYGCSSSPISPIFRLGQEVLVQPLMFSAFPSILSSCENLRLQFYLPNPGRRNITYIGVTLTMGMSGMNNFTDYVNSRIKNVQGNGYNEVIVPAASISQGIYYLSIQYRNHVGVIGRMIWPARIEKKPANQVVPSVSITSTGEWTNAASDYKLTAVITAPTQCGTAVNPRVNFILWKISSASDIWVWSFAGSVVTLKTHQFLPKTLYSANLFVYTSVGVYTFNSSFTTPDDFFQFSIGANRQLAAIRNPIFVGGFSRNAFPRVRRTFQYNWTCTTLDGTICKDRNGNALPSTNYFYRMLSMDAAVYQLTLNVTSTTTNTSTISPAITVELVEENIPEFTLNITDPNPAPQSTKFGLVLAINRDSISYASFTRLNITWSTSDCCNGNCGGQTLDFKNSSNFVYQTATSVKPKDSVLVPGGFYCIQVDMKLGNQTSSAKGSFIVKDRPSQGTCLPDAYDTVTKTVPITLGQTFNMSCSGWKAGDDQGYILYGLRMKQLINGVYSDPSTIVTFGTASTMSSKLLAGTYSIQAIIRDSYGTFAADQPWYTVVVSGQVTAAAITTALTDMQTTLNVTMDTAQAIGSLSAITSSVTASKNQTDYNSTLVTAADVTINTLNDLYQNKRVDNIGSVISETAKISGTLVKDLVPLIVDNNANNANNASSSSSSANSGNGNSQSSKANEVVIAATSLVNNILNGTTSDSFTNQKDYVTTLDSTTSVVAAASTVSKSTSNSKANVKRGVDNEFGDSIFTAIEGITRLAAPIAGCNTPSIDYKDTNFALQVSKMDESQTSVNGLIVTGLDLAFPGRDGDCDLTYRLMTRSATGLGFPTAYTPDKLSRRGIQDNIVGVYDKVTTFQFINDQGTPSSTNAGVTVPFVIPKAEVTSAKLSTDGSTGVKPVCARYTNAATSPSGATFALDGVTVATLDANGNMNVQCTYIQTSDYVVAYVSSALSKMVVTSPTPNSSTDQATSPSPTPQKTSLTNYTFYMMVAGAGVLLLLVGGVSIYAYRKVKKRKRAKVVPHAVKVRATSNLVITEY